MERLSGRSLAARLFGASPERTLALLRAVWPLAVGPELSRRAAPVGVDRGTLRVRVPDATWRRTLHRMQPQILARLRELAGELAPHRMGFVEGPTDRGEPSAPGASDPGVERHAVAVDAGGFQGGSPLPPGAQWRSPPEIKDVAGMIEDPELRARFAATAARYLDRSKGRTDA